MITKVTLYKNTKLREDRNYCFDGTYGSNAYFPTYLESKVVASINNFQILKPLIDLTIKINRNQLAILPFADAYSTIDYVEVLYYKTEGGVTTDYSRFYYFVVAKRWTAEETIALELRMDTLNTFKWNTAYKPTLQTIVEREHKDRFLNLDNPIRTQFYHSPRPRPFYTISVTFDSNDEASFTYVSDIYCSEYDEFDEESFDLEMLVRVAGVTLDELSYTLVPSFVGEDKQLYIQVNITAEGHSGETHVVRLSRLRLYTLQYTIRNIDIYPEGINPVLYKKNNIELLDSIDTSWNLCYLSGDSSLEPPEPVKCELVPDDSFVSKVSTNDFLITSPLLTSGKTYALYQNFVDDSRITQKLPSASGNDFAFSIEIDNAVYSINTTYIYHEAIGNQNAFYEVIYSLVTFTQNGANLDCEIQKWRCLYDPSDPSYYYGEFISNQIISATGSIKILSDISSVKSLEADYISVTTTDYSASSTKTFTNTGFANITMKSINEYDKTNSKLYKIIKLPYAPNTYQYEEGTTPIVTFTENWSIDGAQRLLYLNDLNAKFINKIDTHIENPIYKVLAFQPSNITSSKRNDDNESKLFHSDFYQSKFVYDSFTFVFQLEKMDSELYITLNSSTFKFNFISTTTINSKFLFEFPNYVLKYSTEDYDNILPVARNNEVTIYNNEYLNYLRTAYHYDLKAKERTISTANLGLGLGMISSVSSAGVGLLGGGSPYSKFSAVTNAGTSIVSSIVNTINTIASAEEQFASKQESLKAQSFSVSGSDDVDLMDYYSNNRARLMIYTPSERMKKALADLFYYCGYATNEQKIPNVRTRHFFNFLKCKLVLENVCYNEDVTNDLIAKFEEGVTFIHNLYVYISTPDLLKTFERENYETDIFD